MAITDSFLQLVAIQISYDYFRGGGVRKGHNIITLFSNIDHFAGRVNQAGAKILLYYFYNVQLQFTLQFSFWYCLNLHIQFTFTAI